MSERRELHTELIERSVAGLCIQACIHLPSLILQQLRAACQTEPYAPARELLELTLQNAAIASHERLPICQDTGMTIVYVEVGQEVHIVGGSLEDAIHKGVRKGYREGYLRQSVVGDPLRRKNTGDNTPSVIHTRVVSGDRLKLTVVPKGFGSENMSRLAMLTPAEGLEGVRSFVLETVKVAGANPCPPMVLGVGIGGTFERVAELAKEALMELREGPHPDPFYAELEEDLLMRINALGIGPQGFGGRATALILRIKAFPTHIAGLPVAVNVGCHATRHASAWL